MAADPARPDARPPLAHDHTGLLGTPLTSRRRDVGAASCARFGRLAGRLASRDGSMAQWTTPTPRRQTRGGGDVVVTRVCLYTRISTDEENQPTSLHSQRERLQAFCKAQEDWRVVAHHEDRSTGTKLDRPGLQAAFDLARSGQVDMLLVYRVDRLSRKVRQLAQLAEELDNSALCCARQPSRSTPARRRTE